MAIRNPMQWGLDKLNIAPLAGQLGRSEQPAALGSAALPVRRIGPAELRLALTRGFEDFGAARTDVIFLCVFYPVMGFVLARLAFGQGVLPLLFPLAAGFALLGPLASVGLNEMSRRREQGSEIGWADAFGVLGAPSLGGIVGMGLLLVAIFMAWLVTASVIFQMTMGPVLPATVGGFAREVFTTEAGWALIGLGCGVGFLFAVLVLGISVVTFPLLLDRRVTLGTAIRTSLRVTAVNWRTVTVWGLVIVAGLVLGSIPLFLGLIVVLPVLGHASWHLYRMAA